MTYRLYYHDVPTAGCAGAEEFTDEHQALGRARELIDDGEHHTVAVDDGTGNLLCGVRLQLRLGGFSGD